MKFSKTEIEAFRVELREQWLEALKQGNGALYCVLGSVARSGMSRTVTPYLFTVHGGRVGRSWLTVKASALLGWSIKGDAVRVDGCGMDAGFHLMDCLARAVFTHEEHELFLYGRKKNDAGESVRVEDAPRLSHIWL